MTIEHEIRKLFAARAGRLAHQASRPPIDETTRAARIALILCDLEMPAHARLIEIYRAVQARSTYGDIA